MLNVLSLGALALVPFGSAFGAGPLVLHQPTSVITLSDPQLDYELRAVGLSSAEDATRLVVSSRPPNQRNEPGEILSATIDSSGRVTIDARSVQLNSDDDKKVIPANFSRAVFACGIDSPCFMLRRTSDSKLSFVRLADKRSPTDLKSSVSLKTSFIRRIQTNSKGNLVVLGQVGPQLMTAEVSSSGNVKRYQIYDATSSDKKSVTPTAFVAREDGSILILAEEGEGQSKQSRFGFVGPRGQLIWRVGFSGQPLDLAENENGTYDIVFATLTSEGYDIILKNISQDFGERWERVLLRAQKILPSFRLAHAVGGGVIVAGTRDQGLWMSRLRANGEEEWIEWHDPRNSPDLELTSNVEIACGPHGVVVAYSSFIVVNRQQHEVVRLVRIAE